MNIRTIPLFAFLSALGVLSGEPALAQDLTPRGVEQNKPVAIVNATIHPIGGKAFENGFVLFEGDRIIGLGALASAVQPQRTRTPAAQETLEPAPPRPPSAHEGDRFTFDFPEPLEIRTLLEFVKQALHLQIDLPENGLMGTRVRLTPGMTMPTHGVVPFLTLLLQESGYTLEKDPANMTFLVRPIKQGEAPPHPDGWRVIDAKDKHVYPGLIGANTQLGLTEMQSVRASNDMAETGGVTPEVQAITAINPDSTLLPVTRSAGELLAAVLPSGGIIPGRAGVIRLDGWTVPDMTVLADAGLVINWPMTRTINAWWMNTPEEEQRKGIEKNLRTIEDMIAGAKAYALAKKSNQQPAADIRFDAIRGVFASGLGESTPDSTPETRDPKPETRLPVFIHAQDYDQIQQAVTLCAKYGLRCVIMGGRDAPLCADLLKRHHVSVIVDGTFKFPKRDDSPYDDAYTLPARLEQAGVKWCLASGEETAHERNLSNAAGMAVAYGLDHEAGLRSITLSSAEILGIADRYGSIAPGKSATLIVTDGDVLDVSNHVVMAFLDGREVNLSDKQKALDQRYRGKYGLNETPPNGTGTAAASPAGK